MTSLKNEQINAGSPKLISFTPPTLTGITITSVQALLVSSISDRQSRATITNAITLTENNGTYTGIMAATETAKLLSDPTDGNSALLYDRPYWSVIVTGTDGNANPRQFVFESTTPINAGRNPLYSA